ncbi:MAG: hypothetical protein ACRCYV_11685 [Aeromonas sp.]
MNRAWRGGALCALLWAMSAQAEIKVISVFEPAAAAQTLRTLYPALGVSFLNQQLVLSGNAALIAAASATLAQVNLPPTSILLEWRVTGAWQRASQGGALALGDGRVSLGAQQASRQGESQWQLRGLSGRPLRMALTEQRPFTLYQWQGGAVRGLLPLTDGLYATAVVIGDEVRIDLASEQRAITANALEQTRQASALAGRVGQWLVAGELRTSQTHAPQGAVGSLGIGDVAAFALGGERQQQSQQQRLEIRVTRL